MTVLPGDETFMRAALAEARAAAAAGEVPVGAVVVQGGRIVATGRNAPIEGHDPTAHAEIVALRAAAQALGNYRLDGCTLYVTLEPCAMCSGAMLHARVGRLVFGATEPRTGAAGSVMNLFAEPRLNHHTEVQPGVLAEECAHLLQAFFQRQRHAQRATRPAPVREDALRTPPARFEGLPGLPAGHASHFCTLQAAGGGWQWHWLDVCSADAGGNVADANTWVCLHGPQGWSQALAGWLVPLQATERRLLAPDLAGFGRSDKPKREAWHTLGHHAALLAEWAALLQVQNATLVLPAAMTPLALALVQQAPRLFARCALLSEPRAEEAVRQAPFPDAGHRAGPRAWARLQPTTALEAASATAALMGRFTAPGSFVDLQCSTAPAALQPQRAVEYFRIERASAPPTAP